MQFVSKATLLGAVDLPTERVPVPELGGYVIVRGMSAAQKDQFEKAVSTKDGGINHDNFRAKYLAECLVDEHGHRLVTTPQEIAQLGAVRGDITERLLEVARRLTGSRKEDLDELGKSLDGSQTADSFTNSPNTFTGPSSG